MGFEVGRGCSTGGATEEEGMMEWAAASAVLILAVGVVEMHDRAVPPASVGRAQSGADPCDEFLVGLGAGSAPNP